MSKKLEVRDLSYSYPDGEGRRVIYEDANVSFETGRFYALTGDSGSGKTTFLYVIAGLDTNYGGSVLLDGRNIQEIGLSSYRRNCVSMIYQNFNLIPYLNARENLEIALDITDNETDRTRDGVTRQLKDVGITGKKTKLKSSVLSGGEQQRVAIARALATGSDFIIADEPTGNLDAHASDQVIAIFKRLAHEDGKCVIMVTHNERLAAETDEWFEIDQENHKIIPKRQTPPEA